MTKESTYRYGSFWMIEISLSIIRDELPHASFGIEKKSIKRVIFTNKPYNM